MTTPGACRVCGSVSVTPVQLEEMLFGTREPFTYNECSACGSLSIAEVPVDLSRHYPPTYYSFTGAKRRRRLGPIARHLAITALLNLPGPLRARLPSALSGWRGMGAARVQRSTRILDVGSGTGHLLMSLERSGFKDLHGVDPFIERGTTTPHVTITKGQMADLDGPYGFILLTHSLEHMPDPLAALRDVARLCAPGGHALIGLPVVNRSWRDYGTDWMALDPPRHLFIPTVPGLTDLIESVPGLHVKETWFDTSVVEFYGSELARARIRMFDRDAGVATDPVAHFGAAQVAAWQRQAREYNKRGEAGTASFLVQKS